MAYRSKALIVVALTIFMDSFIGGIVVPVLPLYTKTLGLSSLQLGVVFSSYSVALLFLSIPLGILSDRLGRKKIMVFGMIALTITTLAFALAKSFPALSLFRFFQGIAASATWMVGPALIADLYPPEERGGKMGLAMAGNSFGFLFGPVVGGFLYDWGGYAMPFLVSAGLTALVLLAVLLVIKEPGSEKQQQSPAPASLALLLANRALLVGCLGMLVLSMGFGFIDPLLPGYFHDRFGASPTAIGGLFGAMAITSLVAHPLFGRLSDKLGRVPLMTVGIIVTAITFSLFTFAPTLPISILAMAMLGIAYSLATAPIAPFLADVMPRRNYGTAIGLNNTAFSLGYTAGPLFGGAFVDFWGLRSLFLVYALVLLSYLPFLFWGTRGLASPPAWQGED